MPQLVRVQLDGICWLFHQCGCETCPLVIEILDATLYLHHKKKKKKKQKDGIKM